MSSSSPPDASTEPAIEPVPSAAAELFGDRLPRAQAYVDLLCDEGIEWGLMGPREGARIWTRHVAHCALLAELVPHGASVIDVGTGAGLPGVPLAILRPDLHVTLLEPLARRVRFLELAATRLELVNTTVVQAKAHTAATPACDVATARAVAPLGRLAAWTVPLLRTGGVLLAIRGASAAAEVADAEMEITQAGAAHASVVTVTHQGLDPLVVVRATRVSRETAARARKKR